MREPSLKVTAALSVLLHAVVFVAALGLWKRNSHIAIPSPYKVRIVTPAGTGRTKADLSVRRARKAKAIKKMREARKPKEMPKPVKKEPDMVTVQERIAALGAKKRIRRIVELRRAVLSVRKSKTEGREASESSGDGPARGASLMAGYYTMIQERVWNEWVFPEFRAVDGLETVVNIRIFKDGRVVVQGVERSSGNSLFDRSALRAIAKASPFPPPPYEMQIGLRFTP